MAYFDQCRPPQPIIGISLQKISISGIILSLLFFASFISILLFWSCLRRHGFHSSPSSTPWLQFEFRYYDLVAGKKKDGVFLYLSFTFPSHPWQYLVNPNSSRRVSLHCFYTAAAAAAFLVVPNKTRNNDDLVVFFKWNIEDLL